MVINGRIGAAGWSALATAVTLVPNFLRGISVDSALSMTDGRVEDIRQIWDHLAGPRKYVMVNNPFKIFRGPVNKEEGFEDGGLEDLEKLLEETVSSHPQKFCANN